ncbi:unnamed protein product [Periconia digitata]|uniref:Uncharacterized protein n=1 Tax=Periconia digitata TaxID=1303443 RepID=A0A9W4XCV2_9PLEO|nr:unnamed protein product [Periconia digitata]
MPSMHQPLVSPPAQPTASLSTYTPDQTAKPQQPRKSRLPLFPRRVKPALLYPLSEKKSLRA